MDIDKLGNKGWLQVGKLGVIARSIELKLKERARPFSDTILSLVV
jgi:hypothetical protein